MKPDRKNCALCTKRKLIDYDGSDMFCSFCYNQSGKEETSLLFCYECHCFVKIKLRRTFLLGSQICQNCVKELWANQFFVQYAANPKCVAAWNIAAMDAPLELLNSMVCQERGTFFLPIVWIALLLRRYSDNLHIAWIIT